MKKLNISIIIIVAFVFALASCSDNGPVSVDDIEEEGVTSLALTDKLNSQSGNPTLLDPHQSGNAANECKAIGEFDYAFKIDDWEGNMTGYYDSDTEPSVRFTIDHKPDNKTFDWDATAAISAVIVKGGPTANLWEYDPAVMADTDLKAPGNAGVSHVTFCWNEPKEVEELTVKKTVETTYSRTHDWSIDKNVNTKKGYKLDDIPKIWLYTDSSGDEKATWTVDVTYEGYKDSAHNVSGKITIENTGALDAVIKYVDDVLGGENIDVYCGVDFPYTLKATKTLKCTYDEDGYFKGENKVTVKTERDKYYAKEDIIWGDPEPDKYAKVEITDTNSGFASKYGHVTLDAYEYDQNEVISFKYYENFAWADYGADNCKDGKTYHNTATIVETKQYAKATLKVNVQCYNTESAWALDMNYEVKEVFSFCENGFNNWGWSNLMEPGSYKLDLYAGAGQCDISKGTYVGYVKIDYNSFNYEYHIEPGFVLEEYHIYAGSTMFPKLRNGRDTVAPGQYSIMNPLSGDIYVIAHGVVGLPDPNFGPGNN